MTDELRAAVAEVMTAEGFTRHDNGEDWTTPGVSLRRYRDD